MDTNNNVNDGADMWKSKYHNDSTDEVDDKNNGAEKKKKMPWWQKRLHDYNDNDHKDKGVKSMRMRDEVDERMMGMCRWQ